MQIECLPALRNLQDARDGDISTVTKGKEMPATIEVNTNRLDRPDPVGSNPQLSSKWLVGGSRRWCILLIPFRSAQDPEPSREALRHCLNTLRSMPLLVLPIISPEIIETEIHTCQSYLRWSFLALSLRLSNHPYYFGAETEALNFYRNSAQQAVDEFGEGDPPPVCVIQSLIFLALGDIYGKSPDP